MACWAGLRACWRTAGPGRDRARLADYAWRRRQHRRALRMTGSRSAASIGRPRRSRHKAKRQRLHRELAEQRILADVRKQTSWWSTRSRGHSAAVRPGREAAPVWWPEGSDCSPRRSRAGREAGIPIFRDVDLAHALRGLEEGDGIPEALLRGGGGDPACRLRLQALLPRPCRCGSAGRRHPDASCSVAPGVPGGGMTAADGQPGGDALVDVASAALRRRSPTAIPPGCAAAGGPGVVPFARAWLPVVIGHRDQLRARERHREVVARGSSGVGDDTESGRCPASGRPSPPAPITYVRDQARGRRSGGYDLQELSVVTPATGCFARRGRRCAHRPASLAPGTRDLPSRPSPPPPRCLSPRPEVVGWADHEPGHHARPKGTTTWPSAGAPRGSR